jgi:hypothetical protein
MADGGGKHLLFIWKPSGYELARPTATCRLSAPGSRSTTARSR